MGGGASAYAEGSSTGAQRNALGSLASGPGQSQHHRPKTNLGAEVFGVPRRDPLSASAQNGDSKQSNGHSRHSPNVLGTLAASTPESKANVQSPNPLVGPQPDRPNASARFPGLADYLSGSATPPQNTFQHHLLTSNGSKGSIAGSQPGSGSSGSPLGSALGMSSQRISADVRSTRILTSISTTSCNRNRTAVLDHVIVLTWCIVYNSPRPSGIESSLQSCVCEVYAAIILSARSPLHRACIHEARITTRSDEGHPESELHGTGRPYILP